MLMTNWARDGQGVPQQRWCTITKLVDLALLMCLVSVEVVSSLTVGPVMVRYSKRFF